MKNCIFRLSFFSLIVSITFSCNDIKKNQDQIDQIYANADSLLLYGSKEDHKFLQEDFSIDSIPNLGGNIDSLMSIEDAELIIESASTILKYAPNLHDSLCLENPAVDEAIKVLQKEDFSIGNYKKLTLSTYLDLKKKGISKSVQKKRLNSQEVYILNLAEQELKRLSSEYTNALEQGSWSKRIQIESKLNVLHQKLKQSTKSQNTLIPEDPFALASRETLRKTKEDLIRAKLQLKRSSAIWDYTYPRMTLESFEIFIKRIDNILAADMPGKFRRARDDISKVFNLEKWVELEAQTEKMEQIELNNIRRKYSLNFPSLKERFVPILTSEQFVPNRKLPFSQKIKGTIIDYLDNPYNWSESEASLQSFFDVLNNYSKAEKTRINFPKKYTYYNWMSSQLSEQDLLSLYNHVNNLEQSFKKGVVLPFDLNANDRSYFNRLKEALNREVKRRRNGGFVGIEFHQFEKKEQEIADMYLFKNSSQRPSKKKAYTNSLAFQRFEKIEFMPRQLAEKVKSDHSDMIKKYYKKVELNYKKLKNIEAKLLTNDVFVLNIEWVKLYKLRSELYSTMDKLDKFIFYKQNEGISNHKKERIKLNKWMRLLGGNAPPKVYELAAKSTKSRSLKLKTRQGLSDLTFEKNIDAVATKIEKWKEFVPKKSENIFAYTKLGGRLSVTRKDLWKRNFSFASLKPDINKTRLPQDKWDWKGWRNNATNKPFNYIENVINLKSLEAVGGGIHFGTVAENKSQYDLSDFVLRCNLKMRQLELVGPEEQLYIYLGIDVSVLKALYFYMLSGQNHAISIGWTGKSDYSNAFKEEANSQLILLDPHFVDNIIGQDLLLVDILPWELDKTKLPNGKINPIAKKIEPLLEKFNRISLDRNREINENIDLDDPDNEYIKYLVKKSIDTNSDSFDEESFRRELYKLIAPTTLAVLMDESSTFDIRNNNIELENKMKWKFVMDKPPSLKDLELGNYNSKIDEFSVLTDSISNSIKLLAESYPPLKRVITYSRILGLLRFAEKENIAFDFFSLSTAKIQDRSNYLTPDKLVNDE